MKDKKSYCDLLKDFQVDENKAVTEYDAMGGIQRQSPESLKWSKLFFWMSSDEARHRDAVTRMIFSECKDFVPPKKK